MFLVFIVFLVRLRLMQPFTLTDVAGAPTVTRFALWNRKSDSGNPAARQPNFR